MHNYCGNGDKDAHGLHNDSKYVKLYFSVSVLASVTCFVASILANGFC